MDKNYKSPFFNKHLIEMLVEFLCCERNKTSNRAALLLENDQLWGFELSCITPRRHWLFSHNGTTPGLLFLIINDLIILCFGSIKSVSPIKTIKMLFKNYYYFFF